MIPKIIHQIYLSGDLPDPLQANVERLKALNPGWQHWLWNNDTAECHIATFFGDEMLHIYRRIDPRYGAARADLLRHLLLYSDGGVYFDIKSGSSKPLDDIILPDDSYVLSQWPEGHPCLYPHRELAHVPGYEYVTFFLASGPGHAFGRAVIERISRNIYFYRPWSSVGRNGVLRLTGPIAFTIAVHPLLDQPHRLAPFDELGLYVSPQGYRHAMPTSYATQTAPVVRMGKTVTSLVTALRSA